MKLTPDLIEADVSRALAEDLGTGDVSAELLPESLEVRAEIISREAMLVCGQPWVETVFRSLSPAIQIDWHVAEGQWLAEPAILCQIKGPAREILSGERTALNFFQTLSGTATKTRHYLKALENTKTKLLDTRKTLPGLRLAQKYAVACAGGVNHRLGLYDAFLIKENHIKACGSITQAIQKAKTMHPELMVEVEVENLVELQEALEAKPDRILLDNFSLQLLTQAVNLNQSYGCTLEASGGVSLETIHAIAQTGVDFISVGGLTKCVEAIDLSLLIKEIQ
ncbi:carboxylating nicotinate-nucleotide diphosphorylase [Legionella sp. 16cNR16C]|uniref:carboxylating nicotinate-nucleotide diphosphorylase n=1 Tax=Legionella sp. 16cNR16C TaxID=2905656 RepID=UPI001E5E1B5E|nr:carboxylating nicotinate-nucleotide diphosphorylase [Legionella sp. 16cNR16C]MCE3046137.1 carboxylating nicotinate-nucleotide diphosphorylase [Legionella sp. 16cNR16C]